MMAIEQFDELEQRHTFLATQRKDLVDSIAATGEAIKRIEKTTRERFREAFAAINTVLRGDVHDAVRRRARRPGPARQENDLLESGIDIIAQPPGKRLQNVQLLSGGEKALTAMGLMFAIFRTGRVPFCLLDEIDAPLDDANIGRFVEMLRGMLDQTQFILITPQPQDHGNRGPALRRDDGGAGRLEADLGPPQLGEPREAARPGVVR